MCAPVPDDMFVDIELVCTVIFAFETFIRLSLVAFVPTRLSGIINDDWDEAEAARAIRHERPPRLEPFYPGKTVNSLSLTARH